MIFIFEFFDSLFVHFDSMISETVAQFTGSSLNYRTVSVGCYKYLNKHFKVRFGM